MIRAVAAIERCDVCLLMIDAQEGVTEQDKKIAGVAHEAERDHRCRQPRVGPGKKETNTMRDFKERSRVSFSLCPTLLPYSFQLREKQKVFDVIQMTKYVAERGRFTFLQVS